MRIAISTLIVRPGISGSNESYLQKLVAALQVVDIDNEYFLFVTPQNEHLFPVVNPRWRLVRLSALGHLRGARILIDQLVLPWWARRLKVDVLHYPGTVGSCLRVSGVHQVVTVHYDLDPVHTPSVPRLKRAYFTFLMRRTRTTAEILVVPSVGFARTFGERWGIPRQKLRVVYHGVSHQPTRSVEDNPEAAGLLARLSLQAGYLLSVTNALPHKNVPELLEAYVHLATLVSAPPLVLAGAISAHDLEGWDRQLAAQGLKLPRSRMILTGFLPPRQVGILYQFAAAMITPTFTESSSMPVLEAMACGCPVVASDIEVHREIAGDAAVLVPTGDPLRLAEACARVLTDSAWRSALTARGTECACRFSWEKTAQATVACYRDAIHTN
jgi:glycosyltransferase involved in cell wall biosynthesis